MDDLTRMIIVLALVVMFARGSDASAMQKTKFGAPLLTEKIATNRSIIVDIEGKGDYTSVQKAIDAVPVGNSNWIIVHVRKGIYNCSEEWNFVVDKARRGRMVTLETTTPLEKLKRIVCEDYGVDHNVLNTEFSNSMVNQRGNPPIIITNDRQASNFVAYAKRDSSTILCVTFSEVPEINRADFVKPSKESCDTRKDHVVADGSGDAGLRSENNGDNENVGRAWRGDFVKKDQIFRSKGVLKATMEILAMKNNFNYTVFKSTRKWWYIRCKDALCNWTVRTEDIDESTYFMINQCEGRHSCALSKTRKFGKTTSARTIGTLIQHRFDDANDGPKANDIIQFMRLEHSCEITYWHAWEAREFAIAAARGIPDRSYAKIPAYLHMIKEANPGTHTHYETNEKGRFMYLFMSFGQSVRGFYNAMRRVIVCLCFVSY
ncbi:hypothetical protein DY000_02042683 [Brassica cretica]|uniref:Pectinesterase n=1 Tax=Brassica cretica TaxID=69181 RepID=A0ABQ7BJ33_BRACR|nr:hypothetical protein DY000_02042683 [Brassica cretica]